MINVNADQPSGMIRVLTMTALSWPKAKTHQLMLKAMTYDRYRQPRPHYTKTDWTRAKKHRQINELTQRITSGKQWISTIPTTDPRWPIWQRKLTQLIHQRNALRAETANSGGSQDQQATKQPSSPSNAPS